MKLNDITVKKPSDDYSKMALLRKLPDKRILDVATILVVKHKENYFLLAN